MRWSMPIACTSTTQSPPAPVGERHRDHEHPAHGAVEPLAVPDLVPAIARDEVLEVGVERGLRALGAVDPRVAQRLAARLHALLMDVAAHGFGLQRGLRR